MSTGTVAELKATKTKATKRPDIQLLRAFAVTAVVGYHFELPGFSFGFLGVDIFLVVSGYLVGGNLIREMQLSGKIEFKRFFSARIKRLLPAALAVVLFTLALLQITNQLTTREIRHAFWSLLYVQNINLGIEGSSYLDGDLNPSYFVHYWSLSLEEQFYIIAPILLLIIFKSRIGGKVLPILAVVAMASFVFSLMQTLDGEASAHYSILTRAWQFIIGMLVADYLPKKSRGKIFWAIAAVLVLFFIGSVSFFPELAFPAPGALIPSLFAGLFLVAGSSTPFRLPTAPLQKLGVLIGDISYSMYLVHFPLALLFLKWSRDYEGYSIIILGLVTTFFLSFVSKSFFEDPFRFGFSNSGASIRVGIAFVAANFISAFTIYVASNSIFVIESTQDLSKNNPSNGGGRAGETEIEQGHEGVTQRCIGAKSLLDETCSEYLFSSPVRAPQSANEAIPDAKSNGCQIPKNETDKFVTCFYGETNDFKNTIALVGDSHAAQWLPAFDKAGKESATRVKTYLMQSCSFRSSNSETCTEFTNWVHSSLAAPDDEIDRVFISNRISNQVQNNLPRATNAFKEDLLRLNGHTKYVFLIEDTPLGSLDNSDPNLCLIEGQSESCINNRSEVTFENPDEIAVLELGIGVFIETEQLFCREEECYVSIGGLPVYRDDDHITNYYSESTYRFWAEIMGGED